MNCVDSQMDAARRASVVECPAMQQASVVSCHKNCVVHQLEADHGLKTGSDSVNQSDKWSRTDFEPQHPPNSRGQSYCEPTPKSSTWDRPQPFHLVNPYSNNNFGHRYWPDQGSRIIEHNLPCPLNKAVLQYAPHPSHENQQRPTILVIVVNKAAISQSGSKHLVTGPMSYQKQANQKYVYPEKRRSYQNQGTTCNCCNAAKYAYSNRSETSQFQEQRASNRQSDFGFPSNRSNRFEPCCGEQTPNGSMGRSRRNSQSRWQPQQFYESNTGVQLMRSDQNADCQSTSNYNEGGSMSDPGVTMGQGDRDCNCAGGREEEEHLGCDTEASPECQCEHPCDCESEIGDLERTLEIAMTNKDCPCIRMNQLALGMKNENNKPKKKKRKPRSPFDRFTSPPFVIEPRPRFINCCCSRSCCYPCCGCRCRWY